MKVQFEQIHTITKQILFPGHVNLLNIKLRKILLKRNNFKILDSCTPNASLDISYIESLIDSNEVDMNSLRIC